MQEVKNNCLIEKLIDDQIKIILFDEKYNLTQYKLIELNDSNLNNIYCGIIQRIDYSLESIFVLLEDDLIGFLPFKQLSEAYYNKASKKLIRNISKGDKIIVQVIRDKLEKKLMKLTNNISITSKLCVYLPFENYNYGISENIKADKRVLFKKFLNDLKSQNIMGSLIIRTSAVDSSVDEVIKDYEQLLDFYSSIEKEFMASKKCKILFKYDELIYFLRSYSSFLLKNVYVRDFNLYSSIKKNIQLDLIDLPNLIFRQNFDFLKDIEKQIETLYQREIKLPSNGSIVIEKTEALISIDVNTNKSYKESNMEMTAFKTNIEASHLIIDQIILRNLGGIIVVDFIDMEDPDHINIINEIFRIGFKNDKSSVKIVPINILGVLQISRERKGLSLIDKHYEKCKSCVAGYVKNDNFKISNFFYDLSKYDFHEKLLVEINSYLFDYLSKKYKNYFKKYKKLKWEIKEFPNYKITKQKS